jgi:hypothetical protein
MTEILAAAVLFLLIAGIVTLLEWNHRRDVVPHALLGADVDHDADLWRVRHDLDPVGSWVRPAH